MKVFSVKNATWLLITVMAATVAFAFGQEAQLPDGAGKKILEEKCTLCHGLDEVTENHMSKEDWGSQVDSMIAMGADLTDEQKTTLVEYLTKNFGPKN